MAPASIQPRAPAHLPAATQAVAPPLPAHRAAARPALPHAVEQRSPAFFSGPDSAGPNLFPLSGKLRRCAAAAIRSTRPYPTARSGDDRATRAWWPSKLRPIAIRKRIPPAALCHRRRRRATSGGPRFSAPSTTPAPRTLDAAAPAPVPGLPAASPQFVPATVKKTARAAVLLEAGLRKSHRDATPRCPRRAPAVGAGIRRPANEAPVAQHPAPPASPAR